VALGDAGQRVREGVADCVAPLRQLALKLRVAHAERPELVEEQRPLGIALEECPQLFGGIAAGDIALSGIGDRADLGDSFLDLAVGDRQEELLLA
jgi:hypothetical protein